MSLVELAVMIILPLLSVAIILAFIRLLRGPSLPDRVAALDLIAALGIGMIGVSAIATDQPVLLDVAVVLALTSFLGTVAFAYYMEKRRV
jgi:multicomponent Na+:H+ antiporter subunit F